MRQADRTLSHPRLSTKGNDQMKRRFILAPFAALALVASGCGTEDGASDGADGGEWPDTLVLTLTPSREAQQLIETAEPLAAMLKERLDQHPQAPEGGIEIEASVPTDYAGVIVALEAGTAHVSGGLGPLQMVQAEAQANAQLILQSERFGDYTYVTQWFTNDPDTYCDDEPVDVDGFLYCNGVDAATGPGDGPIGTDAIARVEGERVAFVDQGSASGHLVPSLQLFEAGIDPVDGVQGQFAGGHDNTVLAVYRGDADVGVSFNDARGNVVDQFEDVGQEVVVFAWSFPIPNDGFAVASSVPDDLRQAIIDAFVDIASDPDGVALLNELYNIDGLVEVESGVYDPIRTLVAELSDLLE
jgi:phosphonate transport system substrate-binding protein